MEKKKYRYKVIYTDCREPHFVFFRAYDSEHAEELFWDWIVNDFGGPEGIKLINVIMQ